MPIESFAGAGGLPALRITDGAGGVAEVYLHGAHVTSWRPPGTGEVLFLSRAAEFRAGAPIRGGVPVVFPQFAATGPLAKHGFARLMEWRRADGGGAEADSVTLALSEGDRTRDRWPHPFEVELTVTPDGPALSLELAVRNTGSEPWEFTGALHTYFRVAELDRARVAGLRGTWYWDRTDRVNAILDDEPEVRFPGELDRVYLDAPREVVLHDGAGGREMRIRSAGFPDTVVWNPGAELAATLPDLGDDEYREMVCVEAAQVARPVRLAAGAEWRGSQRIEISAADSGGGQTT